MKLAFADLNFSWPPNGGADADLFHVMGGLQSAGHEVQLFYLQEQGSLERGRVDAARVPFPAHGIPFSRARMTGPRVAAAFQGTVDAWKPDVVFLQHGYTLKPHVALALADYPLVGRYYAHELLCARDAFRFKHDMPCPNSYFHTPNLCRECALLSHRTALKRNGGNTWTADYLAAKAYHPKYYGIAKKGLAAQDVLVVSNPTMREQLDGLHNDVTIIPGGVHVNEMACSPMPQKGPREKKVILMTGRVDDPLKGLDVLLAAGERLAAQRNDFEVWATHFDYQRSAGWYKAIGWHDHEHTLRLYAQADVVVVPSIWEEPFGLVAVEAMAAGRPVCASRVGGLQEIVRDRETGFLFWRRDAPELAKQLSLLLDNQEMRGAMGRAGRARAAAHYDWPQIIKMHYEPLIARIQR